MGLMDRVKGMLSGHKDQANSAVDKGGDMIDDRTGGKYADKVDTGQEKAKDIISGDEPK